MDSTKLDLIKKWQLTCGLRGISVFDDEDDDYEVLEQLEQLQAFEDARNARDVHHMCALDLFKLGLNYNDYMEYNQLVEDEREAVRLAEIKEIEETNELVQEARGFKITKVDGPSSGQSYYEMEVPTKLHGLIKVKARIVKVTWNRIRVWRDYVLPDKTKVHSCEPTSWHHQHSIMHHKFPAHWRRSSSEAGHSNIELTIMWRMATSIIDAYRPIPVRGGKKK